MYVLMLLIKGNCDFFRPFPHKVASRPCSQLLATIPVLLLVSPLRESRTIMGNCEMLPPISTESCIPVLPCSQILATILIILLVTPLRESVQDHIILSRHVNIFENLSVIIKLLIYMDNTHSSMSKIKTFEMTISSDK